MRIDAGDDAHDTRRCVKTVQKERTNWVSSVYDQCLLKSKEYEAICRECHNINALFCTEQPD